MNIPHALRPMGVDLFCLGKKFLVYNLVGRNLKIKYRRSVLGIFWTLVGPMAMAAVYYFVFKLVLNIQIPHYLIFILSGVLMWNFFSQSVMEGMESIVGNWGLVSKVPVPSQVFPYVGVLTNLVTLVLSMPILLGAVVLSGVQLGGSIVMIPYFLFVLFMLTYGFSVLLALAFVYFRDLRHLMGIVMQVWLYATPVIYDSNLIPAKYHWVLYTNPMAPIFVGVRDILIRGTWPDPLLVALTGGWTVMILLFSAWSHKTFGREIVENI